jgi:7,8-dihydropterin-6-yl-methyl-4-(beta-D-ribofuranosyl)aminobenzene 5'-phosphate synthase
MTMTITIIYDNDAYWEKLQADWGFACLVEAYGRRLLFDTGTRGDMLLENMSSLDIEAGSIDEVVISHDHYDHAGGLSALLSENSDVRVYAPSTMSDIAPAREVVYVDQPMSLGDHFYTTGLLKGIEQSLAVETGYGLVVVVGCSHPGVSSILNAAQEFGRPYALIGGLHGFAEYPVLEPLDLVCPTHCTQHIAEIRSRYPDKYTEGGAGRVITT